MPGITNLEITYGTSLAPPGYHKITLLDGGQAELNRSYCKLNSFLWYHDGVGRGDPIIDIKIIHEDNNNNNNNDNLEGYEKINRNILKGSNQSAYFYIKRGIEVDPIGDIRLVYGTTKAGIYLDIDRYLFVYYHSIFILLL